MPDLPGGSDGRVYGNVTDAWDRVIAEARESYVLGCCTVEEFEELVHRLFFLELPIPVELGLRTVPSLINMARLPPPMPPSPYEAEVMRR